MTVADRSVPLVYQPLPGPSSQSFCPTVLRPTTRSFLSRDPPRNPGPHRVTQGRGSDGVVGHGGTPSDGSPPPGGGHGDGPPDVASEDAAPTHSQTPFVFRSGVHPARTVLPPPSHAFRLLSLRPLGSEPTGPSGERGVCGSVRRYYRRPSRWRRTGPGARAHAGQSAPGASGGWPCTDGSFAP